MWDGRRRKRWIVSMVVVVVAAAVVLGATFFAIANFVVSGFNPIEAMPSKRAI